MSFLKSWPKIVNSSKPEDLVGCVRLWLGQASNVEVNQDSCQGSIVWGFFQSTTPQIPHRLYYSFLRGVRGGETAGMCIIHGIAGQNKPSQVVA